MVLWSVQVTRKGNEEIRYIQITKDTGYPFEEVHSE